MRRIVRLSSFLVARYSLRARPHVVAKAVCKIVAALGNDIPVSCVLTTKKVLHRNTHAAALPQKSGVA